jgi:hypothetical protein
LLHGRFLLFNSTNFRRARAAMQKRGKAIEGFGVADGVNLDAPIVFIADPATKPNFVGRLLDEPAEPNALYASGDEPAAGGYFGGLQLGGSGLPSRSLPAGFESPSVASIVARKLLIVNGFGINRNPFSTT